MTDSSLDDNVKEKKIEDVNSYDFVYKPHNMPKERLWDELNKSDSLYYFQKNLGHIIGQRHRSPGSVGYNDVVEAHQIIALIVRELNHYNNCEIDFSELILELSKNLDPNEIIETIKSLEKMAMSKS
jgi:hypothetical protein